MILSGPPTLMTECGTCRHKAGQDSANGPRSESRGERSLGILLGAAGQTLIWVGIFRSSWQNADSDSVGFGWSLSFCVSHHLPVKPVLWSRPRTAGLRRHIPVSGQRGAQEKAAGWWQSRRLGAAATRLQQQ